MRYRVYSGPKGSGDVSPIAKEQMLFKEYVKTGIGAEAYRRVYPRTHPRSTARVCASQLLTKPNIASRTVELRQAIAKRADITEDRILTDYQDALALAKKQEKPDSIVNAATAQAKLVRLLRDRIETKTVKILRTWRASTIFYKR